MIKLNIYVIMIMLLLSKTKLIVNFAIKLPLLHSRIQNFFQRASNLFFLINN